MIEEFTCFLLKTKRNKSIRRCDSQTVGKVAKTGSIIHAKKAILKLFFNASNLSVVVFLCLPKLLHSVDGMWPTWVSILRNKLECRVEN